MLVYSSFWFCRKPRQRNYAFEKSKQSCTAAKTKSHPLGELVSKTASRQLSSKQPSKSNISAAKIKDPLGGLEGSDPLSMLTASSDPLSILAIGNTESNQNQVSILTQSMAFVPCFSYDDQLCFHDSIRNSTSTFNNQGIQHARKHNLWVPMSAFPNCFFYFTLAWNAFIFHKFKL